MLEILCEEIHPCTKKNVQIIMRYIDVISLHKTMVECYELREAIDDDIANNTAIKTHNLIKHLEDFKGIKAG